MKDVLSQFAEYFSYINQMLGMQEFPDHRLNNSVAFGMGSPESSGLDWASPSMIDLGGSVAASGSSKLKNAIKNTRNRLSS